MPDKIIGFSKLSRVEKIDWLNKNIFDNSHQVKLILDKYLNSNKDIQAIHCLLYTSPSPRDRG